VGNSPKSTSVNLVSDEEIREFEHAQRYSITSSDGVSPLVLHRQLHGLSMSYTQIDAEVSGRIVLKEGVIRDTGVAKEKKNLFMSLGASCNTNERRDPAPSVMSVEVPNARNDHVPRVKSVEMPSARKDPMPSVTSVEDLSFRIRTSDGFSNRAFDPVFLQHEAIDLHSNSLLTVDGGNVLKGLIQNPTLMELQVSDCESGTPSSITNVPAFSKTLCQGLKTNSTLMKLVLSKNALLSRACGEALAGVLKENATLAELDLSDNYSHGSNANDCGGFVEELTMGLAQNTALVKLGLAMNQLMRAGPMVGAALSCALQANKTLKEIDVSNNSEGYQDEEGPSFAAAIAAGFGEQGSLERVNISGNHLGPTKSNRYNSSGLVTLAHAVKENVSVYTHALCVTLPPLPVAHFVPSMNSCCYELMLL
jgi:hypothetical protein